MIVEFQVFVVRCSNGHPGAAGPLQHGIEEAVDDAIEAGWLVVGDTHLCPRCKQELLTGKPLSMKQRMRLVS